MIWTKKITEKIQEVIMSYIDDEGNIYIVSLELDNACGDYLNGYKQIEKHLVSPPEFNQEIPKDVSLEDFYNFAKIRDKRDRGWRPFVNMDHDTSRKNLAITLKSVLYGIENYYFFHVSNKPNENLISITEKILKTISIITGVEKNYNQELSKSFNVLTEGGLLPEGRKKINDDYTTYFNYVYLALYYLCQLFNRPYELYNKYTTPIMKHILQLNPEHIEHVISDIYDLHEVDHSTYAKWSKHWAEYLRTLV